MYDLSVLIPARNEMFLSRTVDEVIKSKRGKTEVIIGLDEKWANPPIKDHPDITIIHYPESIGQRAITNRCASLSKAKYVMKVDAHCAFDEGFDVKMMKLMQDNYTMTPIMYNLHAFDWLCTKCGHRIYQSPTPNGCEKCKGQMIRDIIWKPRLSRRSTAYRFDKTLHFQYWGAYKKIQDQQGTDLAESLSLQGSCFMLTRDKYWELKICDEEFGSWGQQGTEVAVKTWLSGGRVVVNKTTWYSHMFRTQGGDFGFPYQISGRQVERARKLSRELFLTDKWDKAIHPFSWLLEKFKPIPDWHEDKKPLKKGICYYTDNKVNIRLGEKCRKQISKAKLPIVSCSLKSMKFGKNIHLQMERSYLAMTKQQLTALENSDADIIFFCEHDSMYHPSHFDFTPPKKDVYYYNTNWWRIRAEDGFALHYDTEQVNFICAYRELLLKHYREKVKRIEKDGFNMRMGFEPGANNRKERIDDYKCERWQSKYPNLDIRHGNNITKSRWKKEQFRNQNSIKGWIESNLKSIPGWAFNGETFNDFLSSI